MLKWKVGKEWCGSCFKRTVRTSPSTINAWWQNGSVHTSIPQHLFGTVTGNAQSTEKWCQWHRWCIASPEADAIPETDAIPGGRRRSAGHTQLENRAEGVCVSSKVRNQCGGWWGASAFGEKTMSMKQEKGLITQVRPGKWGLLANRLIYYILGSCNIVSVSSSSSWRVCTHHPGQLPIILDHFLPIQWIVVSITTSNYGGLYHL